MKRNENGIHIGELKKKKWVRVFRSYGVWGWHNATLFFLGWMGKVL